MFEDLRSTAVRWADDELLDPARYVSADLLPSWESVPADWDVPGLIEDLIAGDPENWPTPVLDGARVRTVAEVLAAGEDAPMSPELVGQLCSVDPAGLTDFQRVSLAVGLARAEAHVAGRKLVAVASYVRRGPVDDTDPARFRWLEIGAALRLGEGAAINLVHLARRLAGALTGTRAAMIRGDVTVTKAQQLVDATDRLTPAECAEIERRVLPRAAGRTPAQHGAAVRRAVETVAPESPEDRAERQAREIRLAVTHVGSGMGELFAAMTSVDLDAVWLGADTWARRAKADGDRRTLDQLRVAALVRWAESFLTHGDPARCDQECQPAETAPSFQDDGSDEAATDGPRQGLGAPRRHGRPVTVNVTIDLTTLLGLTEHSGELLGAGALVPADAVRDLITDARLRRLITDPTDGRLLDLGVDTYRPSAALADLVAMRDVAATTPTGSMARAAAQDLDHIVDHADGGRTAAANLHTPTRTWHNAKTLGGWTVHANPDGTVTWTSPLGRTYRVGPHDYRGD